MQSFDEDRGRPPSGQWQRSVRIGPEAKPRSGPRIFLAYLPVSREKNGKSGDGQAGLLAGAFVLIWGITDESEACWRQNLWSPGKSKSARLICQ